MANKSIFAGMKLARYQKGRQKPSLFSSADRNVEVGLLEAFANLEARYGRKFQLHLSDGKAILEMALPPGVTGNEPGSGSVVGGQYMVKSVQPNYLTCHTWNGTTEGGTNIYIARNSDARSPASETIGGQVWTYAYSPGVDSLNQYRVASSGDESENQIVTPWYRVNQIIHAITVDHSGIGGPDGVELTKLHLSAQCWSWRRE